MPARVAELVDARDLKSLGYFTCAGSIPASGIKLSLPYGRLFYFCFFVLYLFLYLPLILKIFLFIINMYFNGILSTDTIYSYKSWLYIKKPDNNFLLSGIFIRNNFYLLCCSFTEQNSPHIAHSALSL